MATIYKLTSGISDPDQESEMITSIENYWGSDIEEKIYPIPYWKLRQLIANSPSKQAALHVTDHDNRALVEAEWESYNEDLEEDLEDPNRSGEFYFVINLNGLQDIRSAIPELSSINRIVILGRLGRAMNDQFAAYIEAMDTVRFPLTGGGDGTTTGVRLPPGGDE